MPDVVFGPAVSVFLLEFEEVAEALLVCEAMERSGQTVHTSREGEVGIGEGRTYEVSGVGGYISSLVILMDGDVKTHEFVEVGVCEADLVAEVGRVVEGTITSWDFGVVSIDVVVDDGGNAIDLGAEVKAIFEGALPVLALVHTAVVSLHEVALGLAHEYTR